MVMADINDRDRGKRRRRRGGGRKEFETYSMKPTPPAKTPIILAKPPSEKNSYRQHVSSNHYEERSKSPERQFTKPIQVLKPHEVPREDGLPDSPRGVLSTNSQSIPNLLAGDGVPPQVYTLQARNPAPPGQAPQIKQAGTAGRLTAPPEMLQSVKLVDESFNWCETAMDMLLDQTDFFVIGILGLQGVGKSTVMSYMGGNSYFSNNRTQVFRAQGKDMRELCGHQTQGIDMFVTGERVILLDTQPLLSASVLDHMIHNDKKYSSEYTSVENCIEIQSLQVASFLMTVCNVVIVAMDWFADVNLLRLIHTAEMMKPPTPSGHESLSADDPGERYPHLVFLLNKAKRDAFTTESYDSMQASLEKALEQSKLKYKGHVTMTTSDILRGASPRISKDNVNMFLLPQKEQEKSQHNEGVMGLLDDYRGHLPSEMLIRSLRNQVFSLPRHALTHTTLSEKNWFHYAARTWDSVKKSSLSEYNRLLP